MQKQLAVERLHQESEALAETARLAQEKLQRLSGGSNVLEADQGSSPEKAKVEALNDPRLEA